MSTPHRSAFFPAAALTAALIAHALTVSAAAELPKTLMTERGKLLQSQDFNVPVEMTKDIAQHHNTL